VYVPNSIRVDMGSILPRIADLSGDDRSVLSLPRLPAIHSDWGGTFSTP